MRDSEQLLVGMAGEHLVCADLILKGYSAFLSDQGLPYDLLVDIDGKLLKVQVKTTRAPRVVPQRNKETCCYMFSIKRCGKNNQHRYKDKDVDIFALVCLDTMSIGYITNKEMPDSLNLRVDKLKGSYYDEKGNYLYKEVRKAYKTQNNKSELARVFDINYKLICKMLQDDFIPHVTNAKYFSDIIRNNEWFLNI